MEVRKDIRLKNYNYSDEGFYFITICIKQQKHLLGKVINGIMYKNEKGIMVEHFWNSLQNLFNNITLDQFIVMPNHIHGIIQIKNNTEVPISEVVGTFKSLSTNEYIKNVKENNWERFNTRLWHKNYYEHVIRNEKELYEIRKYIEQNPLAYENDIDDYLHNYI